MEELRIKGNALLFVAPTLFLCPFVVSGQVLIGDVS
jgi:hypothetical protein